jgi:hypothetical protein
MKFMLHDTTLSKVTVQEQNLLQEVVHFLST